MKDDSKTSFSKTLALLKNGLSAAVTQVVGNSLFDNLGSKREGKARTNSSPNSQPQRGSDTPDKKKARVSSPSAGNFDKQSPVCNGCGRWLSDKHSHETCDYIKKRLPGYNAQWETVPWELSDACKALKDKIFKSNPGREGPYYLPPPPKPGNRNDSNTKGMVCCNTLSYPNPDSLPLIKGTLMAEPRTTIRREGAAAVMENRPIMDLPTERDNDNIEYSQRLIDKSITIFIDTGSGDNFISTQFAESLINYGYEPILSTTICEVCSPFKETCVPCGHTFSIDLTIKDDNGDSINLNVVAKTLPIKHSLIIGLKDIRENNLMWRFPGVFLSKDFTGYLEGNLLWSYLRAMFKEHLSRGNHERLRASIISIEGDKRLERTAESWDSLEHATVALAVSDAPLRKFEDRIDSSPDPGQSPEQSSTHPLPHRNSQSEDTLQKEMERQRPHTGPVISKKRKKSSKEEKGRQAQSAERGHSGRKA
jgi:hypothetical protein